MPKFDIDGSFKARRTGKAAPAARVRRTPRAWSDYEHGQAKDSGSPPPAPNPYTIGNVQTQSNEQTAGYNAALNRVNWNTPWGSLNYSQAPAPATGGFQVNGGSGSGTATGDTPGDTSGLQAGNQSQGGTINGLNPQQWTGNITLSPAQQALLDAQNNLQLGTAQTAENSWAGSNGILSHPLDISGSGVSSVTGSPLVSGVPMGAINDGSGINRGAIQMNAPQSGPIQGSINTSGVPALVGGDALASDLNTQRDALYNTQASYLDPQWANQQQSLQTQLANQGVMQNSDAWNKAMDDFNRQKAFAYNQATQSAITGAGAEQSRLFGEGLAANQNAFGQAQAQGTFANNAEAQMYQQMLASMQANNAAQGQDFGQQQSLAELQNQAEQQQYGQNMGNAQLNNSTAQQTFQQNLANANLDNSTRAQWINEQQQQRSDGINELNALRSGSQVTNPQFPNAPAVNMPGTDYANLFNQNYQGQLNAYNTQVGSSNSMNSGLMSLASAAAMMFAASDRRAKQDIKLLGVRPDGLGIYEFRYKPELHAEYGDGLHIGVMADEVERIKPEAVRMRADGFKAVNYGML